MPLSTPSSQDENKTSVLLGVLFFRGFGFLLRLAPGDFLLEAFAQDVGGVLAMLFRNLGAR